MIAGVGQFAKTIRDIRRSLSLTASSLRAKKCGICMRIMAARKDALISHQEIKGEIRADP